MILKILFFSLFALCCHGNRNPGLQMRLTDKGMKYAADVGIEILQNDLKNKRIQESGKDGRVEYGLDLTITRASFPRYELIPVAGVGMHAEISGIQLNGEGKVRYKYKKWFFKLSDNVPLSLETNNIYAKLTLSIGSDKNGHPTIGLVRCNAGVSDVSLKFHGGKAWIYNLFRGILEKKIRKKIGSLLCDMAKKEINGRAKSELETFPVLKKIDKFAEIDYSLSKSPKFTKQFMDIYLKGEFKPINGRLSTSLPNPLLTTSSIADKMLYFWLTEYTFNTAAEVYFKGGFFKGSFQAWDKKMPSKLKDALNTKAFSIIITKLRDLYPNRPMGIDIYAYKAPSVEITPNGATIKFYTRTMFNVLTKNNKVKQLFGAKLDVYASVDVGATGDRITGSIQTFNYDAKIDKIYLPGVTVSDIPLNSPLTKVILDMTVIEAANPYLKKGFQLPNVDEATLRNFDVKLMQKAVRIGTDIRYVKKQ